MLRQAVRQAAKAASFQDASEDLQELAGVTISPTHLQRLSHRLGTEWADHRDEQIQAYKDKTLPRDYRQAPAVAAVLLDGGRYQTRAEDGGRGVRDPRWRETKVACCQTYTAVPTQADPQPQPPAKFLHPEKVKALVASLGASSGSAKKAQAKAPATEPEKPKPKPKSKSKSKSVRRPRRVVRTVVATTQDNEAFGWQVAAEVHRRGLDRARRKACLGDGSQAIWALFALHLAAAGFVAILDVVHLLGHLYAAAQAASGGGDAGWELYGRWLTWAWTGQTVLLLAALRAASRKAGLPEEGAKENDPKRILAETVTYVTNNRERMNYPEYRRLGLPISSAPVESVIKQINRRVKGSEKFWRTGGAEAILQVRSAYLSEDERAEANWSRPRPRGQAVGGGRLPRRTHPQ